ncbi:DEKNAAC102720 [Brettanomyces naardenensis]|uniref:Inheritance of peroxisomes protein 1 n=1 Tax=Brettanomyces naardenensis TaxID=13370 RepID=A0A448YL31_BRENA|nr:DEKNAAC102720 [Brettanomyces naardenensis]
MYTRDPNLHRGGKIDLSKGTIDTDDKSSISSITGTDTKSRHGFGTFKRSSSPNSLNSTDSVSHGSRRFTKFFKKLNHQSIKPVQQTFEVDKTVLFDFPKAKMTAYEAEARDSSFKDAQGSLLAQGKIEIYQLSSNRTNYLVCGKLVHPLMKMLKVFKTGRNVFVFPLYNPERYWKLVITTADEAVVSKLVNILKMICDYKDLTSVSQGDDTVDTTLVVSEDRHDEIVSDETVDVSDIHIYDSFASEASDEDADRTLAVKVQPSEIPILHPVPIRPSSAASSLDSVLGKFNEDKPDDKIRSLDRIQEEGERGNISTWMDPQNSKTESKNIRKRFSLTFKEISPTPIGSIELAKHTSLSRYDRPNGADIVRNSYTMGSLHREPKDDSKRWSSMFGW